MLGKKKKKKLNRRERIDVACVAAVSFPFPGREIEQAREQAGARKSTPGVSKNLSFALARSFVFFANAGDGQYSNERSEASVKTAWENGERPYGRVRLARFTSEDRAYGASRLPKTSKNDCSAVTVYFVPFACFFGNAATQASIEEDS